MEKLYVYAVLSRACQFLRKNDLADALFYYAGLSEQPINPEYTLDTDARDYKLLMSAINQVYEELVIENNLLCNKEYFEADSLDLEDLEYNLAKIIEVRDSNGKIARYFKSSDSLLFSKTDKYSILYSYKPDAISQDIYLSDLQGIVSLSTLAYGVASQFCLMDGIFDEAELWEVKYKESLLGHLRRTKNIKMRERVWL